jgi:hypothetical protein
MKFRNTLFLLLNLAFAFSAKDNEEVEDPNLPQFSLASGFYNQESIELEISVPEPGAIIYYTLDGTIPNETSSVYEAPFTLTNKSVDENVISNHLGIVPNSNFTPPVKVNKGNIIRAIAKLPSGEFTKVVSKSYFVGLDKTKLYQNVPIISIITEPDNLFDYEKGIYVLGKAYDEYLANPNPFGNWGDWGNGDWGNGDWGNADWGNFGGAENPANATENPFGGQGGNFGGFGGFGGQNANATDNPFGGFGGFGGQNANATDNPFGGFGGFGGQNANATDNPFGGFGGFGQNANNTENPWGDWGNFTWGGGEGDFDWAAMFAQGNYNQKGKEAERPATIEYIPGNGNIVTFAQDIGLRLKGRSTRANYQKSFHIHARKDYSKKNMKYELIDGNIRSDGQGPVTKYKSFNLRNAGNDSENAKMRDIVIQELIKNDYVETQQNNFAIVFIDGEYWGIYDIYEEYDDNYIANNYAIDNENVIMIKEGQLESGEEEDKKLFDEAFNFIANNDMSVQENYAQAANLIDMQGFALFTAFYTYVDVQDGFFRVGNYAAWRVRNPDPAVPKADGKWRMMIYDTDLSFGIFGGANDGFNSDVLRDILGKNQNQGGFGGWFLQNIGVKVTASLLKNPNFKNMFINAVCDIKNIYYEPSRVNSVINEKESILLPLVQEHYYRNGPARAIDNAEEDFKNNVEKLRDQMQSRNGIILSLIQEDFELQAPIKVKVTANNYRYGSMVINGLNEFNKSYSGEYFKENILYITAVPKRGRRLRSWDVLNGQMVYRRGNTIGIRPLRKGCSVKASFY